jgi:cytochrome c biogenesis factor
MRLRFEGVTAKDKTINIGLFEKQLEFVVVKVLFFPWIIIVWVGSIIMFIGLTIGVWRRAVKAKQVAD